MVEILEELAIDTTAKMGGMFPVSSGGFFGNNIHGGWATVLAILFILIFHYLFAKKYFFSSPSRFPASVLPSDPTVSSPQNPQFRISDIVSDADLRFLIENLNGELNENEKWESVVEKRNILLYYNAKCCKPKDGPLKYLSMTVFENCSPEMLRDFYMDNDYRKQWDKTLVDHQQMAVNKTSGVEVGRSIKKFPLLTPREYVLGWRLWEGDDKTYYCFIRECEHPLALPQRKYVRVRFFRSGWRIRKVPGRNACEIKMFHQEDAGLNVEIAKLAFSKGIWNYVCKMDNALRKYSPISHPPSVAVTAVTLMTKAPPGIDSTNSMASAVSESSQREIGGEEKKLLCKRPSKKMVANGLLLLGGMVCLSHGYSKLGAKVAVAYILTKLRKQGATSSSSAQR